MPFRPLLPVLAGALLLSCTPERSASSELSPRAEETSRDAASERARRGGPPLGTPDATALPDPLEGTVLEGTVLEGTVLEGTALEGTVVIDGSSTVYPLTEAVAGLFEARAPRVDVTLGVSGTGGGFAKFCRGLIDIADASRPIQSGERALCTAHGVEFIELPVAFDGISVVAHPGADWVHCLTVDELRRLWRPEAEGVVTRWDHLRDGWPEAPLALYAPGRDSGTFDYFTRAVVGVEGSARADFVGSEDDYLIAQDVAGDLHGLGFFGYSYYAEYRDRLRLVAVDGGAGCVAPSEETIASGTYVPLSRPVFVYVAVASLERPAVAAFLDVYLASAPAMAARVGSVPLPPRAYSLGRDRLAARRTGSLFDDGSQVGVSIEALLAIESADAPTSASSAGSNEPR